MLQQISISRDDCYRVGPAGKRDEIIVVWITQEGGWIDWIVQHDPGISNRCHDLTDLTLLDQVTEVGLAQRSLDLGQ